MGICLPVVEKLNAPLIFRSWSAHTVFVPDALGVRAPDPRSPETRPDLVVCPLLAFDAQGHRLGQGGGYYDRTLHQLRLEGPIIAIGLAFAEQEVEALPADDLDQRLDGILTETGYRAFS
jgi:5-formyltetrahydrofolate cyclo-ligase